MPNLQLLDGEQNLSDDVAVHHRNQVYFHHSELGIVSPTLSLRILHHQISRPQTFLLSFLRRHPLYHWQYCVHSSDQTLRPKECPIGHKQYHLQLRQHNPSYPPGLIIIQSDYSNHKWLYQNQILLSR